MTADPTRVEGEHLVSVVVPVYNGEHSLTPLLAEIAKLTTRTPTPGGRTFRVVEVLLVHDCGRDDSPRVIRELAATYDFVRPIWLSRNYGQHAATLAGMSSSGGEWIATIDEDGQHDPADLAVLLDTAVDQQARLVYARPTNPPPHSAFRNLTSRAAKQVSNLLSGGVDASVFHSYRLVLGEVGRSVAAYAGAGVYLDVALSWVAARPATAPVRMREETDRASGYSVRRLLSHFWRMIVSSGTRSLRIVSGLGVFFATLGVLIAIYLIVNRLAGATLIQGWTSLIVVVLLSTGAVLFSLGVIAEYVGVAVNMAMGKPLYLITSDPADGPLGRDRTPPRP